MVAQHSLPSSQNTFNNSPIALFFSGTATYGATPLNMPYSTHACFLYTKGITDELPCGGYRSAGGYRRDTIAYRSGMGHQSGLLLARLACLRDRRAHRVFNINFSAPSFNPLLGQTRIRHSLSLAQNPFQNLLRTLLRTLCCRTPPWACTQFGSLQFFLGFCRVRCTPTILALSHHLAHLCRSPKMCTER